MNGKKIQLKIRWGGNSYISTYQVVVANVSSDGIYAKKFRSKCAFDGKWREWHNNGGVFPFRDLVSLRVLTKKSKSELE